MKTLLRFSCLMISLLLLSACDDFDAIGNKGKFYYSNPSTSNIWFKVDGKRYEILPNGSGVIMLSSGIHHLENDKGEMTEFMIFENNSGGILNPNHFIYYTLSEVYAVDGKSDRFKPASYPITINGHKLDLPIRSANAVIIDTNLFRCSYPIGEAFPDSITLYDDSSDGNIKSKCFDQLELVKYMANEYNQNLMPATLDDEGINSINMVFNYDIPKVIFNDKNVQLKAQQLVALTEQLKNTDDVDIHKKLNKEFHQATIEIVHEHANSAVNNTVEENIKYNDFIQEVNTLRGNGVWIKLAN
ncbi:hypothetical protein [Providencia vermicola]|uniref:hypothetical protein n=1 Tax=Providencia vermicola TaxID=333965 RepID=UPI0021FA3231|nr:hypothetical protein NFC79_15390 [Providencia stuartii]